MRRIAKHRSQTKNHVLGHVILLAVFSLFLASTSQAASSKRIERSIDAADLSHIDFDISVAEIDIQVYDGDTIELDIEVKADRDWWFFGRRDVDDIELEVSQGSEYVDLRLDEDNLEQDWRVMLPAHLAVSMELGVGELEVEGLSNEFVLEIGVGAVEVIVDEIDYESIRIVTGVGDLPLSEVLVIAQRTSATSLVLTLNTLAMASIESILIWVLVMPE